MWLQHVAHMGEIKMHQKVSLGNMKASDPLRDLHTHICEDGIKMYLKEIG
jgi:hypothetical protein